jgi:hypothetical protein
MSRGLLGVCIVGPGQFEINRADQITQSGEAVELRN